MKHKTFAGNIPAFVPAYNSLYNDIVNGIYAINEHLPNEPLLAKKYGISRNTLRHALSLLSEDGLIIKSQGKGTVVAPRSNTSFLEKVANPHIQWAKETIDEIQIHSNFNTPAPIASKTLNLQPDEKILASNCIYFHNHVATGFSFVEFPVKSFPDFNITSKDITDISYTTLLTDSIFKESTKSSMEVKLISVSELETMWLDIPLGTQVIYIEMILYNHELEPIARNKLYFIPEHYNIKFIL